MNFFTQTSQQNLLAKNILFALLFSLVSTMLLTACNKKGNKTEETGTNNPDLLTLKPWKLVKIEYRYNENASWQDAAPIPDCQKDDTSLLKNDNTVEFNGGTIKCDANEKQTSIVANWKWNDAKTEYAVTTIAPKFTTVSKVIKLTETEQIITFSVTTPGSPTIYYKDFLTH